MHYEKTVPRTEVTLAEQHLGLKHPVLYPACNISGLNCWSYDWVSYYGRWEKYQPGRNIFKPGNLFCMLQFCLHPPTVWLRGSVCVDVVHGLGLLDSSGGLWAWAGHV